MSKKIIPFWVQYFITCSLFVVLSIFIISIAFVNKYIENENEMINGKLDIVGQFFETNFSSYISNCYESACGTSIANDLNRAGSDESRNEVIKNLCTDLYAGSNEIISILYIDKNGHSFSIGEGLYDLNYRKELIDECRKAELYKEKRYIWRYEQTKNKHDTLMLCADVVYMDDDLVKNYEGTMLMLVDSSILYEKCLNTLDDNINVVLIDYKGTIAVASNKNLIGKHYNDSFVESEDRITGADGTEALFKAKKSDIDGFRIISFITLEATNQRKVSFYIYALITILISIVIMLIVTFLLSKRVGRAVTDIKEYVNVTSTGSLVVSKKYNPDSEIGEIISQLIKIGDKIKNSIEENYRMQQSLNEITMKAYDSQMNSHFLFNTLQLIQAMNSIGEYENVQTVTVCLGKLLRFNLDSRTEVLISEEIDNVENYLKILKLRFCGRFKYNIWMPDDKKEYYSIKFLIQPFIENSISHGFKKKKGVWEVAVTVRELNGELAVIVKDNGVGIERDKLNAINESLKSGKTVDGMGIGIRNVNERIKILYGEKYGVHLYSSSKGSQVLIHLPVRRTISE